MLTGTEMRARVREGLANGRLWRLAHDRAKLHGAIDGNPGCHVCSEAIPCGQAFSLVRGATVVLVHLECYMFWLYACGLLEREPITCAGCRRLIPPHAESTVVRGAVYHLRCRDRMESREPSTSVVAPRDPGRANGR
jgi:hypothetical protein